MYYIKLGEGLRDACHLELLSVVKEETHETYFMIERHGHRLWTYRVAEIEPVAGGNGVLTEIWRYVRKEADTIVNTIFESIDWDTFFEMDIPEPEEPYQHPYTKIRSAHD